MGSCCSCCLSDDDGGEEVTKEMELQAKKASKDLAIVATLSQPSIKIKKSANVGSTITGTGLALAGAALEQDAAYWEWHVHSLPPRTHIDTILFGVSTKKNRDFYNKLKEIAQDELPEEGTPSEVTGTQYMRKIEVQNKDVVGVAVQQSDLPMVQFFLNGEPLHESAINRFRGTVYPAICLPESAAAKEETSSLEVSLVMNEKHFQHMSPGPRFGPVIVARSIV